MKDSLSKDGLSMSQAQSVSNLCNQRAEFITSQLRAVNNSSKTVTIAGKVYTEQVGVALPVNIVELLKEKSMLHAVQAFLMENIKAKATKLVELQTKSFVFDKEMPTQPELKKVTKIENVTEAWGWDQLSLKEYNSYLLDEAFAAHLGQFIHKHGLLTELREELPLIRTLEWMSVKDGERIPVEVTNHHTGDYLMSLHEIIAGEHRKYEQSVNYIKAKVKNLVTDENARIAKENADALTTAASENLRIRKEYQIQHDTWLDEYNKASQVFEEQRQKDIHALAGLRIKIDAAFKKTVDEFLSKLDNEEEK